MGLTITHVTHILVHDSYTSSAEREHKMLGGGGLVFLFMTTTGTSHVLQENETEGHGFELS